MGIGVPGSDIWSKNLVNNRCKYVRVFLPVLWTGEKNPNCRIPCDEEGLASKP